MNPIPLSKELTKLRPEWETSAGAQAIQSLAEACVRHHGGGTVPLIDFLLGLYNGGTWKPDMQLLCRRIDDEHFDLVLKAMKFIRQTNMEPHELFAQGNALFDFLKETAPRWAPDPAEQPA